MLKINGVELDIDFTDADAQEAYAKANEELQKKMNFSGLSAPESTRKASANIRDFIDSVFGEGLGAKVLPKDSMRDTMAAVEAIVTEANAQFKRVDEFGKTLNLKISK